MPNQGKGVHLGQPAQEPAPAGARIRFALDGVSRTHDPRTVAIRPDLADIAVAGTHFAPHYAAPLPRRVTGGPVALRTTPADDAEVVTTLADGAGFALLDTTGGWSWGYADDGHLVGYLPAGSLA